VESSSPALASLDASDLVGVEKMTGSFAPGVVHFRPLTKGFADLAYAVGEDHDLLVSVLARGESARKRMPHLRKHRINERRSVFRDVSGAYYWHILRICGCGWRHDFLECRLRADEWHTIIIHGSASSDSATQHTLGACAKIHR